ncbi:LytTR family two component transcriptional regulator [Kordia periserrulae]|uniref:LytTR family two component transcriptional regulator n=1 Tax=Kordia periserrulae TaxID=701523 RepID=A0A2T6C1N2_9FLAO|nr:LytTR family DNA-binding domain-containing protein [Kordia periserrulae]PTX62230.1 LytTR family two component transcriptional regulator [Kordia periserrulae]
MKVVIIEDEAFASKRLKKVLEELVPDIEVQAQLASVESSLNWLGNNPVPDLIFLDIQLNDGYGFDILDKLKKHPPVIFTTAYNEYAIKGFKYNSIDYILKPIDKKDLAIAMNKYRDNSKNKSFDIIPKLEEFKTLLSKDYKRRFMVKVGNHFNSVKVENIAYFFSDAGIIFLKDHKGNKFPLEYSLDQLEEILNPLDFFRINRKYLVQLNAVGEIHQYFNSRLLLKLNPDEDDKIIVSRERCSDFKKWLDL